MNTVTKTTIKTLALDLEATLISNAMSQFPRSGLCEFLKACEVIFGQDNIVMYTTVNEMLFRQIASQLYKDCHVPKWFITMRYIKWEGEFKNLNFVDSQSPGSVLLVDDYDGYIHPEQRGNWVFIKQFEYPEHDDELNNTLRQIRLKISQDQ